MLYWTKEEIRRLDYVKELRRRSMLYGTAIAAAAFAIIIATIEFLGK